jgi:hypothetical protein
LEEEYQWQRNGEKPASLTTGERTYVAWVMKSKRRSEGRLGSWKACSHEAVVAESSRKRPGFEDQMEIKQPG